MCSGWSGCRLVCFIGTPFGIEFSNKLNLFGKPKLYNLINILDHPSVDLATLFYLCVAARDYKVKMVTGFGPVFSCVTCFFKALLELCTLLLNHSHCRC